MQNQMLFTPKFKELAGNLPLTNYSDVIAVYSLRRMWMNYSGPLIKVFRASDSVEMDIGYGANGLLDTTTLLNFIGTGDGFVSTWYDQSGNNRHLNKVSGGNRPAIVLQGRITMHNKRAGLYFNQVSYGIQTLITNSFSFTTPFSWYVVSNLISKNTAFMDGGFGHCMSVRSLGGVTTDIRLDGSTTGGSLRTSNMLIWAKSAITWFYSNPLGSFCKLFANNVLIQQKDTIGPITSPGLCMGGVYDRYVDAGNEFYIHEFVLFNTSDETKRINLTSEVNSHYQLFWDGSKQGLLDKYPNSVAAYSLRALRSGYTGPIVAIRRSNGGEVMNFYANYDGDLDVKAIREFCGTGDGFISTWYDQSGSGRHLTQTDTSKQPHIVIAGEVQLENGKLAIRFGKDSITFLSTSTNYLNGQSFSFLRVMDNYGNVNFDILGRNSGTSYARGDHIFGLQSSYTPFWTITTGNQEYVPTVNTPIAAAINDGQRVFFASRETADSIKQYKIQNNELIQYEGTSVDTTWVTHNSPFIVGTLHLTSTSYFRGTTQEWIYWSNSNFNNSDLLITDVNDYYNSFNSIPAYNKQPYNTLDIQQFRRHIANNFGYSTTLTVSVFGSVSNGGVVPAGNSKWGSAVLAPNGFIYCVPYAATSILKIDPNNNTASLFGSFDSNDSKWSSATLAPNGKIYCAPFNSGTILVIDPSNDTTYTIGSFAIDSLYSGSVLAPNGKIYCVPSRTNNILVIDPSNDTYYTFWSITISSAKWSRAVLGLNGKIYCIPLSNQSVLVIDPSNDTTYYIGSHGTGTKWISGALAPNGKIYCAPVSISSILVIDPSTDTTYLIPTTLGGMAGATLGPNGRIFLIPGNSLVIGVIDPMNDSVTSYSSLTTNNKFSGGILARNGRIYCIPSSYHSIGVLSNQTIPLALDAVLSRHINKT